MRAVLLSAVIFAFGCGLLNLRSLSAASKTLCLYLGLCVLSEVTAFLMARLYRNNMPVFHVFNPLLFVVLAVYFQRVSPALQKWHLGYWSAGICVAIGVLNTTFSQPIGTMNSNYLLLEGLFACALAFAVLYDLLKDEDNVFIFRVPHFWITVIVLFHYLATYVAYLGLRFLKISGSPPSSLELIYTILWLTTVLTYLGIALSLLLLNDKQKTHE